MVFLSAGSSSARVSYSPIFTRTATTTSVVTPVAFNCVKFIIIREGHATFFGEFGKQRAEVGDVVVLDENTLCGAEPEQSLTTTTLNLDRAYVVDQVFWQYASQFGSRCEANSFLDVRYAEPGQIAHIGERRTGLLLPWLDELTAISLEGISPERFYRAQSLLFAVLDVIIPYLAVTGTGTSPTHPSATAPSQPRHREFIPLRHDARDAALMLSERLDKKWTVAELACAVHLSTSQIRRLFVESFGKSPIAYLTMLRVDRMAELLRSTKISVTSISSQVGWSDPEFAARQFRRSLGVSPSEYRRIVRRLP